MLRWYQEEACAAAWEHLCNKGGNPVIVLPTGAGKTIVLGELCRQAVQKFRGRVLVLAHRRELLQQNAEKIRLLCPGLDVGVYSAGLKTRDTNHSVVVAGIQSAFRRAEEFGPRHLVLIDEVHLASHDGEGMYRTFLDQLRAINPQLRMVGTTATPFRLDCGPLCRPDGLFQKVCYSAPVRQLIAEGFLCNLVTSPAETVVDTSKLHLRGGEFIPGETSQLFSEVVEPACREIVAKTAGRHSILVFSSGVAHAEQVVACLNRLTGGPVGLITGETFDMERANTIADFKACRLRYLVNVDVLTCGFDAPNIDAIAILRATMSPGLFCQMVGRGFRISPTKRDALILDFGGNIRRHGPVDAPEYGIQDKRQKSAGEAPTKTCPNCGVEATIGQRQCNECHFIFAVEREPNHDVVADNAQILSVPEMWIVEAVTYGVHYKRDAPGATPTMRVNYECYPEGKAGNLSMQVISEWVCIEHDGFARRKAEAWWAKRSIATYPCDVEEAVDLCERGAVAAPRSIMVQREGRWWRVLSAELDEIPEEWFDEVDADVFADEEVPF